MSRRQHGEGAHYQRGKRGGRAGQWVAVADLGFREGKRDRREFTGATSEEARRKREAFLDQRRDGFTLPRGRQPYVSDWVLHWLHNVARPSIDPNTFSRSYRPRVTDCIVPYFARVKLAELSEEDIEGWHRWLAARPSRNGGTLAPGTVRMAHKILSASLNVAVARRKLPHNPCTFVPAPKNTAPPPQPPTAEEIALILERCKDRPGGARWVLAVCTGLRQGEALGLRWRDVHLAPPARVTVAQSLAWVEGRPVLKSPKTAKSRRTVPLPAAAAAALKEHRRAQVTNIASDLVFTTPAGEPVRAIGDWRAWQALLDELGLPRYRVHDLRHAYATMLLEGGADPRLVQDLMGWSSARMAEVYQHVRPAMHARAVAMMDEMLGGT
jgi:integrase